MKFYIGMHEVNYAGDFERCMINIHRLHRWSKDGSCRIRRSDFPAQQWRLDLGGFTEIIEHGRYRMTEEEAAAAIARWSLCGHLECSTPQDWPCIPAALEKTGLSVEEHQWLTIESFDRLSHLVNVPIMPMLHGLTIFDYAKHLEMYGDRIQPGMVVGVGSIARFNGQPDYVARLLRTIHSRVPNLRLHGLGIGLLCLRSKEVWQSLDATDSMAWQFHARKQGRNPNDITEAHCYLFKVEELWLSHFFLPPQHVFTADAIAILQGYESGDEIEGHGWDEREFTEALLEATLNKIIYTSDLSLLAEQELELFYS